MKKLELKQVNARVLEWENPAYPVPVEPPKSVELAQPNAGLKPALGSLYPTIIQPPPQQTIIYMQSPTKTPEPPTLFMPGKAQEISSFLVGATMVLGCLGLLFYVGGIVFTVIGEALTALILVVKEVAYIIFLGIGCLAAIKILPFLFQSSGRSTGNEYYPPTQPTNNQQSTRNITININESGNQYNK